MKKFTPILLAAMLTLAACGQTPTTPSSVSPSSEAEISAQGGVTEPSSEAGADQPKLIVADAAMYRGTLVSIEETAGGKTLLLEQAEGTDYGSPRHTFSLTENTRLSFPTEQLVTGAYLEVFYGVPVGQEPDPEERSEAIAINRYPEAAMVVFNGTLRSSEKDAQGKGRLVLEELGSGQEVIFHFDDSTQFYLNYDALKPGDTLNLLHQGMFTMSIPPQGSALEVSHYSEVK